MPIFSRKLRLDTRSVRVQGHKIRYREAGAGPTVLFVHGLTGSTEWWTPTLPALLPDHRVVLVDLPGFGAMWWRRARLYLSRAAEWLHEFVHAAELEKFALVGHSMGGMIALQFAARHAQALEALVLVSPAVEPRGSRLAYALPLLRTGLQVRPRFARVLLRDALRAGPLTTYRLAGEILATAPPGNLAEVAVRTKLIWGYRDPLVPVEIGRALAAKLPDAELTILRQAGHVPMFEAPGEFNRALITFLGKRQ